MAEDIHELVVSIGTHHANVGILGIGYVGSTLGEQAAKAGFEVVGYDISPKAIRKINARRIPHFQATNVLAAVLKSDIICICVPTPVTKEKIPDLSLLQHAAYQVSRYVRKGQLVIVESTIAPGTTRRVVLPILEKSGLTIEKDFFLAFSPERVDPGNRQYAFAQIPKVVGGIGPVSSLFAKTFYSQFVDTVMEVSSPETAEMAKMLENTFRLVNISLINELSEYAKAVGINIAEVIQAASTKPFGFMPHYPGPGIGGHCIPVDPYYILHDAKNRFSLSLGLLHAALITNEIQPLKVVKEALRIVKQNNGFKRQHRILLVGVSYKPNVGDIRETPAVPIAQELVLRNVAVSYYDPFVKNFLGKKQILFTKETIEKFDLGIVITPHKNIDYTTLVESGIPILDTCNAIHNYQGEHIYNFFVKQVNNTSKNEKSLQQPHFLYD